MYRMYRLASTDPDYSLWVLFARVRDAIHRAWEHELSPFGISPIEAAVLFAVQAYDGPMTAAELARLLLREPHSVSGLLNRMEKEGLVRKTNDLERKNLTRITLTEKGQKAYKLSSQRKVIRQIFSVLSEEQRQQLTTVLEALLNGLVPAVQELLAARNISYVLPRTKRHEVYH